jgi:hypothetical protein
MAVVQGVKEKVHLPIYDSLRVNREQQLSDVENSSTWKFFIDVQGKTKLETNLQSAGLLPHYNTFEARAMRVVISDLPAEFPNEDPVESDPQDPFDVEDDQGNQLGYNTTTNAVIVGTPTTPTPVTVTVSVGLADLIDQIQAAQDDPDGEVHIAIDDDSIIDQKNVMVGTTALDASQIADLANAGGQITLTLADLQDLLASDSVPDDQRPLDEQIYKTNGFGTLLGKVVYNTVTSLYVGEKVMIQMPTWFFPGGAGPYSEAATVVTHGEPTPLATFRFAEPIFIDKQQNFRVEIEVPDSDVLKELKNIYGPFFIWVVLDGYMTRDVQ